MERMHRQRNLQGHCVGSRVHLPARTTRKRLDTSPCQSARSASHLPRAHAAHNPRGPIQRDQRHCNHLMFDINPRFMDARRQNLSLSYISQQEAGRQGLAAMRSFLDFQMELDRAGASKVNLLKAALMISLDQNIPQTLERLESVVAMVQRHMKPSFGPLEIVRCINSVLYDFYRFSGAKERFYHLESASLARLLQYKTGGPTALGILYIAVAERVGLRLAAVSLPSHFLVRPLDLGSETDPVFIDPYNGGVLYDIAGVARMLHDNLDLPPPDELSAEAAARAALQGAVGSYAANGTMTHGSARAPGSGGVGWGFLVGAATAGMQDEGEDDDDLVPMYEPTVYGCGTNEPWFLPYLEPVGKLEVLMRLLRNMREVLWVPLIRQQVADEARMSWQAQQALSVLRMMRAAEPHNEEHVVSEALCLAVAGRQMEGCELLRGFLREHPEALGAVRTLYGMEAENRVAARLAAVEKAQRDKEAAEAARQRTLRARLAGLKGFNGHDPNAVLNDPSFFSRMYGRLWDDNYWISAMLDHHSSQGGADEDDDDGGGGSSKGAAATGSSGGKGGSGQGGGGGGGGSGKPKADGKGGKN
ncbi:hypothetical protein VaNZ11_002463 [Volvox africanus]|uniref:Protein SirB1 N-terminal domain-containing protein n=1 Tax=Volvox africanus TaxID=51714 RepID=A0ABQ5RSY0_9CHLO|nr:hypothetical protein VaNZ11_002463 [Volvox africanus]